MPCLLQSLRYIVDRLGLNEPLAPSPLPFATVAAIFSPPSPTAPTYVDQVLDFLADCAQLGQENPLPAALALAGMLLMILPLYEATLGQEDDVKLYHRNRSWNDNSGKVRKAESTTVCKRSQPTKRLENEVQMADISKESDTAEDTLEREGHDEWNQQIDASLPEDREAQEEAVEMETRIERDLMDRMETEGKIETDLVEKMEQEAEIEKELAHALKKFGAQPTSLLLFASSFTMSLTRSVVRFGRPTQMGKRVGRRRGQNQDAVRGEKLTLDLDPDARGEEIPELKDDIHARDKPQPRGITDIKDISYGSDISVVTNVSDITDIWT